jgi:hypothetical protein
MTLPYRQRRVLRRAAHALRRSDPELASMLSIFARLAGGEAMPAEEQLPPRPTGAWKRGLPRSTRGKALTRESESEKPDAS